MDRTGHAGCTLLRSFPSADTDRARLFPLASRPLATNGSGSGSGSGTSVVGPARCPSGQQPAGSSGTMAHVIGTFYTGLEQAAKCLLSRPPSFTLPPGSPTPFTPSGFLALLGQLGGNLSSGTSPAGATLTESHLAAMIDAYTIIDEGASRAAARLGELNASTAVVEMSCSLVCPPGFALDIGYGRSKAVELMAGAGWIGVAPATGEAEQVVTLTKRLWNQLSLWLEVAGHVEVLFASNVSIGTGRPEAVRRDTLVVRDADKLRPDQLAASIGGGGGSGGRGRGGGAGWVGTYFEGSLMINCSLAAALPARHPSRLERLTVASDRGCAATCIENAWCTHWSWRPTDRFCEVYAGTPTNATDDDGMLVRGLTRTGADQTAILCSPVVLSTSTGSCPTAVGFFDGQDRLALDWGSDIKSGRQRAWIQEAAGAACPDLAKPVSAGECGLAASLLAGLPVPDPICESGFRTSNRTTQVPLGCYVSATGAIVFDPFINSDSAPAGARQLCMEADPAYGCFGHPVDRFSAGVRSGRGSATEAITIEPIFSTDPIRWIPASLGPAVQSVVNLDREHDGLGGTIPSAPCPENSTALGPAAATASISRLSTSFRPPDTGRYQFRLSVVGPQVVQMSVRYNASHSTSVIAAATPNRAGATVLDASVMLSGGDDLDVEVWSVSTVDRAANLLLGQVPSVSSVLSWAPACSSSDVFYPGYATDGNTDGGTFYHSLSLTDIEPGPVWLEVPLAEPSQLDRVVLWNRVDCCDARINGFVVQLRNGDGSLQQCGEPLTTRGPGNPITVSCGSNLATAVAVRLWKSTNENPLHIVELQAFALRLQDAEPASIVLSWTNPNGSTSSRLPAVSDRGVGTVVGPTSNVCRAVPPIYATGSRLFEGKFRTFESEAALLDMIETVPENNIGAIVLEDPDPQTGRLPAPFRYTLRWPTYFAPSTNKRGRGATDQSWRSSGQNDQYMDYLFAPVQDMVDHSLLSMLTSSSDELYDVAAKSFQPFPIPRHVNDGFATGIAMLIPLVMVLAWIYTVSLTVKAVVLEKECRVKESMKMNGLKVQAHWISWFLTALTMITASAVPLTVILHAGKLFPESDPVLVFLYLETFAVSSVTLSFLVSTLFSKARVASACAGLIYFMAYLPYVFMQKNMAEVSIASKYLLCLFSPSSFAVGCEMLAQLELTGVGLQWSTLSLVVGEDCHGFSIGDTFFMVFFDAILYMVACLYVEAVFPGEFGVPRPWDFCFKRSFWLGDAGAAKKRAETAALDGDVPTSGLVVDDVSKEYDATCFSRPRQALQNVSFVAEPHQVTGLLGHNGAGKSTMMSIIAGLFPPTSGTAYVDGYSIRNEIDDVHQRLGICMQSNCLWPTLTVNEHLQFCGALRGLEQRLVEEETTVLLSALKLLDKRHTKSSVLSGGMKRKLSVAMAFFGKPSVVILDEPTAGMDPSARRLTWDLILARRAGCTVLLSTHHMDEADLLSSKVVVVATGKVRASGSCVALKREHGSGYTLSLYLDENANREKIKALVESIIASATIKDDTACELAFMLPVEERPAFPLLLAALAKQDELGIISQGISASTLEQVFLNVIDQAEKDDADEEHDQVLDNAADTYVSSGTLSNDIELSDLSSTHSTPSSPTMPRPPRKVATTSSSWTRGLPNPFRRRRGQYSVLANTVTVTGTGTVNGAEEDDDDLLGASEEVEQDEQLQSKARASTKLRLSLRQFRAVYRKRLDHTKRDRKTFMSQIVLPVVFVCLAMWTASLFPDPDPAPAMEIWPTALQSRCEGAPPPVIPFSVVSPIGDAVKPPVSRLMADDTIDQIKLQYPSATFKNMTDGMAKYILDRSLDPSLWSGFSVVSSRTTADSMVAWYDSRVYHALPVQLALLNSLRFANQSSRVTTLSHPLPKKLVSVLDTKQTVKVVTDLTVALCIIISFSFVPASCLVFLVSERATGFKHQQFSAGLGASPYWAANLAFDVSTCSISAAFSLATFAAFQLPAYTDRNLPAIAALLFSYCFAIVPYVYPATFLFEVPSTAFIVVSVALLFVGLSATITTTVLDLVQGDDEQLNSANSALKVLLCVFPNYNLGRGIIEVAHNEYQAQYLQLMAELSNKPKPDAFSSPLAWNGYSVPCSTGSFSTPDEDGNCYGGTLRFVAASLTDGLVMWIVVWLLEKGMFRRLVQCMGKTPATRSDGVLAEQDGSADGLDDDVAAESERAAEVANSGNAAASSLLLNGLSKTYTGGDGGGSGGSSCCFSGSSCSCCRGCRKRSSKKVAVSNLSLVVKPGECFGLLGVNGAGKTTTFKMVTGALRPTNGEAWIAGHSLLNAPDMAKKQLGYCPQVDSLGDLLTARETLTLFARIRGLPSDSTAKVADTLIRYMQLTKWADRTVKTFSGGNKRKLSVAVALLAHPKLVLADEPSTGMDPRARRFMWERLKGVLSENRSVVLTSHSMEECETLCDRMGIMVNGQLQCIGSPQHLKTKFGKGYTLVVNTRGEAQCALFKGWQERCLPAAVIEEEHSGYLRLSIPAGVAGAGAGNGGEHVDDDGGELSVGRVFELLEQANDEAAGGLFEDYTLAQTSLEHIFCAFADKTRDEDEDD